MRVFQTTDQKSNISNRKENLNIEQILLHTSVKRNQQLTKLNTNNQE